MTNQLSRPAHLMLGLICILLVPIPLAACSLCGGLMRNQDTLSEELERARLVVYGRVTSSEMFSHPGAIPGSGRTEFQIERVIKDDALLTNKRGLTLNRWLPVPDPRDPQHYVMFCSETKGQLDAYLGKGVRSNAIIAYLEGAGKVRKQGRVQALHYYYGFLDSADELLASDAFLEFARSNDQEVEQARRTMKPEKIRALMQNPRTKTEYLGLLAFLLGGCGQQRDADFIMTMIERNDEASRQARDGLLSGYLSLKPREGWEMIRAHLADHKRPIVPDRYSAINALRFCYTLKLGDHHKGALRCLEVMLPDGEAADFAVEDMRKWQLWELAPAVLAQYEKPSHAAPITRRAIVRYALCCPRPEAKQFLDHIRLRDQEMIREVAEGLQFEK